MVLLFTTRKIDKNDERVGFVFGWILEFAKHLTKLVVICQEKGDVSDMPGNVEVYSLGKEKGYGKFRQLFNFQKIIYKIMSADKKKNLPAACLPARQVAFNRALRSEGGLSGIFSHMVPHFAFLAGPWCKIYHKKLVQWYVHKTVSPWLKVANLFVDGYVTVNQQSFRMKTKKIVHYFGHGIDINKFQSHQYCHPDESQDPMNYGIPAGVYPVPRYGAGMTKKNDEFIILSVSRISPSKNINLMIQAVEKIFQQHPELKDKILLQIIGAPGLKEQQTYHESLIKYVASNNLAESINFLGPLSPDKILPYYQNCDLFLNLSDTGSVDKAVLEAMACEKMVLTSNEAFKNIVPEKLFLAEKDIDLLANKILEIYNMSETEKTDLQKNLRQEVVENHNLEKLTKKIIGLYIKSSR